MLYVHIRYALPSRDTTKNRETRWYVCANTISLHASNR